MSLVIDTPPFVHIRNDAVDLKQLQSDLTYIDKSIDFAIRKLKKARWFDPSNEDHAEKLANLQTQRKQCLLFENDSGYYTYSGLATYVSQLIHDRDIQNNLIYPDTKLIPYSSLPPAARPYQLEAFQKLLEAKHGAVQMGTGLGKSYIIALLCKHFGIKAVVTAPTTSIAEQLYDDFLRLFGKKYVGRYYGGKKEHKKLFTIAIHASLTKIEEGSDAWDSFVETKVAIFDESHMTPAESLHKICIGLLQHAPYRFFFSGTQTRGDGADLLLKGIIGPIVFEMTVQEGVDQGFLSKPVFRMIRTFSDSSYTSQDVNKMTAAHLLYNPIVNKKAAQIANTAYNRLGHAVLVLVDEIAQFRELEPLFAHPCEFAYGGTLSAENKKYVPEKYQGKDNKELVEAFNAGRIPILVGTSAISMGTDIRRVQTMINLMGGKSPIQVPQAVGRCTRLCPEANKTECNVFDFDVTNIEPCHRHALARADLYGDIYPSLEWI